VNLNKSITFSNKPFKTFDVFIRSHLYETNATKDRFDLNFHLKSGGTMFKRSLSLITAGLMVAGLAACDVDQTQEGNVDAPAYEVEKTQEGNLEMPKYDVDAPNVDTQMEEKKVEVPNVDVKTEGKTVEVPDVDVNAPKE
jgi:hypothetical protein